MNSEKYKAKNGNTQFRPVCTESELWEDRNMGFCLACGSEAFNVEPDARKYSCESCQQPKVYGLEELALMGLLKVVSED